MEQEKKELRKQMKELRSGFSKGYKEMADRRIAEHLWQTEEYRKADLIFCYVSTEEETDTRRILERALSDGKRVAVPVCREKGRMEAWEIKSLSELAPGAYGILEPQGPRSAVPPAEIDLCLVPCLACDLAGGRLGYGGGYYDRFLKEMSLEEVLPQKQGGFCREMSKEGMVRILCLCRESQILQGIPMEEHDVFAEGVITEGRVIYC